MKRILYVGLAYNYGKKEEGASYESVNIQEGLLNASSKLDSQIFVYHPDCIYDGGFESTLIDTMSIFKPDAIFHVAFNESLDLPESVAKLALKQDVPVIQWDCDSSWRFQNWIFPRRDRVSHFVTTHSATIPWYEKNGMKVIKSQWAGSPLYIPEGGYKTSQYECSFVGQKHGQFVHNDGKKTTVKFLRGEIIDAMMSAGIKMDLFGNYWDGYANWHGYKTDFKDVIDVFQTSKISLNLSNPWHHGTMPQIKGRHFEIPQAGSLQISTPADDLTSYFKPDSEIVIAESLNDLVDKTKYYLEHEKERNQIACAGQLRNMMEHQWHHRFEHIFKEVFND